MSTRQLLFYCICSLCFVSFLPPFAQQSKADDLPHPLWKYPLQFVFTSLKRQTDWGTDRELREAATMEIKTVKSLVQRCANNWPRCWGEKDLSSLCVMVPTRFAVSQ